MKKQINVRIGESLLAMAKEYALKNGLTLTVMIEDGLRLILDDAQRKKG